MFHSKIIQTRFFPILFCALLSSILFFPFFLGKYSLAGTDLLFHHYPNLLFGLRSFEEFGRFSLWNPYIFAGTDFTQSMHTHYLNPLYWPLLIVPEIYRLHGLTFLFMIMNACIGWAWFNIARHYKISETWSLLVSIIAQSGMFFWFAMTTMIAVPMYLFASLACLCILTRAHRSSLTHYIILSFTLAFLFITPHPAYILGFFIPILLIFICDNIPFYTHAFWKKDTLIFFLACITAIIIAAYRLFPIYEAIHHGIVQNQTLLMPLYANNVYFNITNFNPLAFGLDIGDALGIAKALAYPAVHTQMHTGLYFGIVPLAIIFLALRTAPNKKLVLLAITLVMSQMAYIYSFEPIYDLMQVIFYPFTHVAIFRIFSNFIFLFLFIFCIKHIISIPHASFSKALRETLVIFLLILTVGIIFCTRINIHLSGMGSLGINTISRVIILCILVSSFLVFRLNDAFFGKKSFGLLGLFIGGGIVFLSDYVANLNGILLSSEAAISVFKNTMLIVFLCAVIIGSLSLSPLKINKKLLIVMGIVILFVIFLPLHRTEATTHIAIWSGLVGWGIYIVLFITALNIFGFYAKGMDINKTLFLLILLTLIDLISSYKDYSYVNFYSPFLKHFTQIYPTQTTSQQETKTSKKQNLLINHQIQYLGNQVSSWSLGGGNNIHVEQTSPILKNSIKLCYGSHDASGNLFQDVTLTGTVHELSAGVWVKSPSDVSSSIFLTSTNNTATAISSKKQQGDEQWHWINTHIKAREPLQQVRLHLNLASKGCALFYHPKLVEGSTVNPSMAPNNGDTIVQPDRIEKIPLNFHLYRVNHVDFFNFTSKNEGYNNYAMLNKTPTYSGLESDQPSNFIDFLSQFKIPDPVWIGRFGLTSTIENERFLNLLGVAYDVNKEGNTIYRPHAIPRMAAFSAYEVEPDYHQALQKIKSPAFDETRTLLLNKQPEFLFSQAKRSMLALSYTMPHADEIKLQIHADSPRLILFNDRYSPYWLATWNGKPLKIQKANIIFMAVSIPPGSGTLKFIFHPNLFFTLVKMSILLTTFLLFLCLFLFFRKGFNHYKCKVSN